MALGSSLLTNEKYSEIHELQSYTYNLYGFHLTSTLALPELLPTPADRPPEVSIGLNTVPAQGLPGATALGPFCQVNGQRLWLEVPEVARFLVEDGRRITIDPFPGSDEASIRVFLLGSCLGALLFQRGLLVLHGNAIRVGDACLVCAGDSGVGKSTLAAAFMQRGHEILADDVVAVNSAGQVIPGFPRLKLWRDAARQLNIDTEGLSRIRPTLEKFNLPLGKQFCGEPLPLRWLYVLDTHNRPGCELEPVHGMARFEPLRRNTYRVRYLHGMDLRGEHLKLCGQLAGRIRLVQVRRAQTGLSPDELAEALMEDATGTMATP